MINKLYYRTTFGVHNVQAAFFRQSHFIPCDPSVTKFVSTTPVVVQVEADEGTHLKLENLRLQDGNPAFHTMSLLVAGTTLCTECASALFAYGITASDTMWTAAKKLAAIHPGLRATRF